MGGSGVGGQSLLGRGYRDCRRSRGSPPAAHRNPPSPKAPANGARGNRLPALPFATSTVGRQPAVAESARRRHVPGAAASRPSAVCRVTSCAAGEHLSGGWHRCGVRQVDQPALEEPEQADQRATSDHRRSDQIATVLSHPTASISGAPRGSTRGRLALVVLVDDVHGGFLGAGAGAVDPDITGQQVLLGVGVAVGPDADQPSGPDAADFFARIRRTGCPRPAPRPPGVSADSSSSRLSPRSSSASVGTCTDGSRSAASNPRPARRRAGRRAGSPRRELLGDARRSRRPRLGFVDHGHVLPVPRLRAHRNHLLHVRGRETPAPLAVPRNSGTEQVSRPATSTAQPEHRPGQQAGDHRSQMPRSRPGISGAVRVAR